MDSPTGFLVGCAEDESDSVDSHNPEDSVVEADVGADVEEEPVEWTPDVAIVGATDTVVCQPSCGGKECGGDLCGGRRGTLGWIDVFRRGPMCGIGRVGGFRRGVSTH